MRMLSTMGVTNLSGTSRGKLMLLLTGCSYAANKRVLERASPSTGPWPPTHTAYPSPHSLALLGTLPVHSQTQQPQRGPVPHRIDTTQPVPSPFLFSYIGIALETYFKWDESVSRWNYSHIISRTTNLGTNSLKLMGTKWNTLNFVWR